MKSPTPSSNLKEIPPESAARRRPHRQQAAVRLCPFCDNWELSTARSTSMVKFSIENSVPASRLVAAVSEFQPLDPADTEEARNRTAVLN